MRYTINDYLGQSIVVEPQVKLYLVKDFMGNDLLGLCVTLNQISDDIGDDSQYATLTTSFGDFIGIKNAAYIDTNNCPFANQLLEQGVAVQTGLSRRSGYCQYPLWIFDENFLKEHGVENYQKYSETFDSYVNRSEDMDEIDEFDEEPDEDMSIQ